MSEQTFIPGTEPQLATGPWTGEVDAAEAGKYLVVCSNRDGDMDVFYCDGDGAWICERYFGEQPPPRLIARIHLPEVAQ
jgi:hypothetical protein